MLQFLGKQSQQDSFSACGGKQCPMGQSEIIRVMNPMLVNNYNACRNRERFPDNLRTKLLVPMPVVSCAITIVLTSFMF